MRFEDLLIERGLISEAQLAEAREAAGKGMRLDQAVVQLGLLPESEVLQLLGNSLGLEVISLADCRIDPQVLGTVSSKVIFKQQVVPVRRENGSLIVATSNPFDIFTLDEIHSATGLHVEPVLAAATRSRR
ncbi:MAG: hypothetical protein U1D30_12955 [Planctomycetota bacterium]